MRVRPIAGALIVAAGLACAATAARAADPKAVIDTYADLAHAVYEDSLTTAQALQTEIDAFLAAPGAETQAAAKDAWLAAREPYQQSEVYRFGNVIVDEWEGKVNAWPLDEGLIDYVSTGVYGEDSEENPFYTANVIAHPKLTIAGKEVDASVIDKSLIRSLHEIDDVEANVSTGYHAIEFLLWGQDLNGTGPGAGARPWSDFALGDPCTGGNCDRRRAYLKAAADLLVDDLQEMTANWGADGAARQALTGGAPEAGISVILTGMGSLSYGELAGERMKLGLMLHDPEEEHDCFSDNTHNSHYYDAMGIRNIYVGRYERVNGAVVEGASVADLVRAKDAGVDDELKAKLDATMAAMSKLKETADSGTMAYHQMLGESNDEGNARVQAAIDALVDQTKSIERAVAALDLGSIAFEGSDSLDSPSAVFE